MAAHGSTHRPTAGPVAEQSKVISSFWGGGSSPFAVANSKLAMWVFLIGDTLIFASFIVGYGLLRHASPTWPNQEEVFSIPLVSLMTFILICSSATMAASVGAARRHDAKAAIRLLMWTIVGGLFFLGSQAFEWTELILHGARLFDNPWGVPALTASFFTITAFHGLHVLVGVIYLGRLALKARQGQYSDLSIEVAGIYWHFVDLVWVFIFTLFYLL